MKVIIAGGRTFQGTYEHILKVDHFLSKHDNIEIVSGTARGADQWGEWYAEQYGHSVKQFPADWAQYGKRAGYLRNVEMAEYADVLIAFWDGQSRGTKHMIDTMEKKGKPVRVIRYD